MSKPRTTACKTPSCGGIRKRKPRRKSTNTLQGYYDHCEKCQEARKGEIKSKPYYVAPYVPPPPPSPVKIDRPLLPPSPLTSEDAGDISEIEELVKEKEGYTADINNERKDDDYVNNTLKTLKLEKYVSLFKEAEFDKDAFFLLTESRLISMSMPLGPMLKILHFIQLNKKGIL